jgi:hypothetical protein
MSRYLLCNNDPYPDVCAMGIEKFKFHSQPAKYRLTQPDVTRFDILMGKFYGDMKHMDLVLMINAIDHRDDLQVDQIILLPTKDDLDRFIYENSV